MKKTQKKRLDSIVRSVAIMAVLFGVIFLASSSALAAFGEDVEKPKPVFTQDGETITAKLLPRGKSTSVVVLFAAAGGALKDVQPVDFSSVKSEGIDRKDFRCDLFTISLDNISPGGEISVVVRSDFFSSSTRFFLYNSKADPAWNDALAQQKIYPDRVRELVFTVRDGGPYDADGATDGKIQLICGPWDSFWGYAIGTLFIRFFGVFLVLGVLMIGMIVCGKIFERSDKRKAAKAAESKAPFTAMAVPTPKPAAAGPGMESAMAAAIAMALHLELSGPAGMESDISAEESRNAWGQYGRQKLMSDRMQAFKRYSHV